MYEIDFINDLPLNEVEPGCAGQFFPVRGVRPGRGRSGEWSWVTDLEISRQNARWLVRGGTMPLEDRERDIQYA